MVVVVCSATSPVLLVAQEVERAPHDVKTVEWFMAITWGSESKRCLTFSGRDEDRLPDHFRVFAEQLGTPAKHGVDRAVSSSEISGEDSPPIRARWDGSGTDASFASDAIAAV
jgi:hypothetical protein